MSTRHSVAKKQEIPDLPSQLEDLLDAVWDQEADWRLDDKIDLAMKVRRIKPKD